MPSTRRSRPKRLRARPPQLTEALLLSWCDDHHARTGSWPTQKSGQVLCTVGENYKALDMALRKGSRGLPGGSSLAQLLAKHRDVRNKKRLPLLTEQVIVALADVHFWWTGSWPTRESGPVLASLVPEETWARIDASLIRGLRGLRGRSSLARLLAKWRKVRNRKALPRLTEQQIVAWADAYFARHGQYPSENAGPVEDAPGEVWINLTAALREGLRGLRGGSSIFKLLVKHGRVTLSR